MKSCCKSSNVVNIFKKYVRTMLVNCGVIKETLKTEKNNLNS